MTWTDERIRASLASLAEEIDWPGGQDLAPRVASQIKSRPAPSRRWLAVGLAGLVALLLLFTAPGQQAVAWLLRLSGIRIELTEPQAPMSPPDTLAGGVESSFAEAESAVGFRLGRPSLLDSPDSIQILRWSGGQQVAMVWGSSPGLPEVFDTGTGLLLIQFEARVDQELLLKQASEATQITPVRVNGAAGFFLSDAPHTVFFESEDGRIADDEIRLAGNVLVWMSDGVTYRIESALGIEESLEIAESVG